jgi:hypothetical protein
VTGVIDSDGANEHRTRPERGSGTIPRANHACDERDFRDAPDNFRRALAAMNGFGRMARAG